MSPSPFDELYAVAAAPLLLETLGRDVIVHRFEENPVTVHAVVSQAELREEMDAEGRRRFRETVNVLLPVGGDSALTDPAALRKADDIEIDGERWAITAVMRRGASLVSVECGRTALPERTRPRLRAAGSRG